MASAAAAAAIRNIIQIESVGEAKGIKLFIKLNHKRLQNGGGGIPSTQECAPS
jgi:hypothetical protein